MDKMWAGRTEGKLNKIADDFNSSISFDYKLYKVDINGSIAHAKMLAKQKIISESEKDKIITELKNILSEIESGNLKINSDAEDIHMFVESVLTQRIGEVGKKLHTARSRNDQVALDLRLYIKSEATKIKGLLKKLVESIMFQVENNIDTIMPGYTHLQRAQPITFSEELLAYVNMFFRDNERINDCVNRMDYSPLGSCALAGTTYDTDRKFVADELGFKGITKNSIDGVSDRDFCIEYISALSILMMHFSRFSEEIILYSSLEFDFIELNENFTTGSSIMPQKKNSDMAELTRGKTGRVYGDLFSILTIMKGLPLAYNKDMQEDKECLFDANETVQKCLKVFAPMIKTLKVKKENMLNASKKGFINATDLADYLVSKGLAFRSAYKIVGKIVADCISKNLILEELSLNDYKNYSNLFENDVYESISLINCVNKRNSAGGTGIKAVKAQIQEAKEYVKENFC